MQCACAALLSVACLTLSHFSTLSHKRHDFHGKKIIEYRGLFLSPSGNSELDYATTKTDMAERSISIGRESLQVFFLY